MAFEKFHYKSLTELTDTLKEQGYPLPAREDYSVLATPVVIGGKTIPNRIAYQPMEGCDGTFSGSPDTLTVRRYRRFAKGGPGLIWFEATAITEDGRANPRQLWLREENKEDFRAIVRMIKDTCREENGFEPLVIMQATHSGRYSKPHGKPEPIIAYNNPIFEGDKPLSPDHIITDERLRELEEDMVRSALLAQEVGFDGVDVKCCHRYLNCELLSAYNRPGEYGGSFENRTRFYLNCVRKVKKAVRSDFIVTSRLNVYDGFPYPYGFGVAPGEDLTPDMTEAKKLIGLLAQEGIELIDITMGNPYFNPHVNRPFDGGPYVPQEHPLLGVGRMLHYTGELQKAYPQLKIICSGTSYLREYLPNIGAGLVEEGMTSLVGIGRMAFAYPDFAKDVVAGKIEKNKVCITCGMCSMIMRNGSTPGCVVRDGEVYLPLFKEHVQDRNIIV